MNILIIPDPHLPFEHPKALAFVEEQIKRFQPDEIIFLGDISDQYAWSKYPKTAAALNASQELKELRSRLKQWVKLIPTCKVCIGNHDRRIAIKLDEASIPSEISITLHDLFQLPDTWIINDEFVVDNILFKHGDDLPGGRNATSNILNTMHQSTVTGHLHSVASITWRNNGYNKIFSMVCGCLVDTDSYAAAYGKKFRDKPMVGVGVILDGTPIWLPLVQ
jgi:metallophosphoesterase superfamily enzyme